MIASLIDFSISVRFQVPDVKLVPSRDLRSHFSSGQESAASLAAIFGNEKLSDFSHNVKPIDHVISDLFIT